MKHKHAEVLKAIADGKAVQWLRRSEWVTMQGLGINPIAYPAFEWRIAPETLMIGDMEVPKPCSEVPDLEVTYYFPTPHFPELYSSTIWCRDNLDLHLLHVGMLHLTAEAAITHAKALIKISGGTYE